MNKIILLVKKINLYCTMIDKSKMSISSIGSSSWHRTACSAGRNFLDYLVHTELFWSMLYFCECLLLRLIRKSVELNWGVKKICFAAIEVTCLALPPVPVFYEAVKLWSLCRIAIASPLVSTHEFFLSSSTRFCRNVKRRWNMPCLFSAVTFDLLCFDFLSNDVSNSPRKLDKTLLSSPLSAKVDRWWLNCLCFLIRAVLGKRVFICVERDDYPNWKY